MCVQFLWSHHRTMIYSVIQHGQIVCDSIMLSSIITTDISLDVTTLLKSNIFGKNKAENSSMTLPLAAAIWQKREERDILQGKL